MDDIRPIKRARQACEPCRRKKSKCPGDRPVCSHCQRLGQECVYNENDNEAIQARHNKKMEQRIDNLEGKMDQLLEQLTRPATTATARQPTPAPAPPLEIPNPGPYGFNLDGFCPGNDPTQQRQHSSSDLVLCDAGLLEAGRLYLIWCHKQPVSLFREEMFVESLKTRDRELLLALQALSLRFPAGTLTPQKRERLDAMSMLSRRLVMDRVVNGDVELSTLQSLCLLSMVDFAEGKTVQAGANIAMASQLANSIQPKSTLGDSKECSNCIKSISLLQNLQGSIFPDTRLSNAMMASQTPAFRFGRTDVDSSDSESGILKYTLQLSEIWHMARAYVACRVKPDALPPWNPHSDYSVVMQYHLDLDCRVPLEYRFCSNRFGDYAFESLQERREYWGPWLYIQFVYSAIPCLLNHPFLLSMRLRNFRYTMPLSFIHQSFELITRHAGWIIYFIDLLEKKSFQVSDPTLAHCVAIVATIHLQHSFVQDPLLRDKAQAAFERCMNFLQRMGSIWPSVSNMAQNLRKLQKSVVFVPCSEPNSADSHETHQSFSIDAQLLWDILIYETAGRPDAAADQSMFGASLAPMPAALQRTASPNSAAAATEFDLVGSAGISGHKSVSKQSQAYAPNDAITPLRDATTTNRVPEQAASMLHAGPSVANRYLDGVGGEVDHEGLFLQADDFGRAIDNWLDLERV